MILLRPNDETNEEEITPIVICRSYLPCLRATQNADATSTSEWRMPPTHLKMRPRYEYKKVPRIAIVQPIQPCRETSVPKKMTADTMMTTRFRVLPMACVTGRTRPSAMNAVSL